MDENDQKTALNIKLMLDKFACSGKLNYMNTEYMLLFEAIHHIYKGIAKTIDDESEPDEQA